MSCNCCCVKTLKLCSVPVCGDLDFGITAQVEGVHKLSLDFLGIQMIINKEFDIGEEIIFPMTSLNENFTYYGKLSDPDGKEIVISKGGIEYDCVKFETSISVVL